MAKDPPSSDDGTSVLQRASLKQQTQEHAGAEVPLPSAAAVFLGIGYADDNDLIIKDPHVSAHHCRLWRDGERLILEDLSSTNGTHVDGVMISRAEVSAGAAITLGRYAFDLNEGIIARLPKGGATTKADEEQICWTVGRDARQGQNDIVIDHPQISRKHAEFIHAGNGWFVRDLDSTHGTFAHSPTHRIQSARVTVKDTVYLGTYPFAVSRLQEAVFGGQGRIAFAGDKAVLILGRDSSCDVQIPSAQVSRRHARIRKDAKGHLIEDLRSTSGVFLNGQRTKRARFTRDDVIGLGAFQVRIDMVAGTLERSYRGDMLLQAEDITVKVDGGRKTILSEVSLTAYPGEFVGLMGPSGAGKTTLMMALNGYLPPTRGRTLINGSDLYRTYDSFRGNIGYVPQDDIIHSQLTVWEALYYTAKLRLPPDTTKKEIDQIISRVLSQLEISETRDVLIGSPENKGISGGQRKRVNLAQELITQPSMLLLDEPTSGLASEDTINVMRLLRRLADGGRTIVLTIHQPSLEAYRSMDNVVYLADGHLVYYGPTYPDSITYFNPGAVSGTPQGDRILADPGSALKPLAQDKRDGKDMAQRAKTFRRSTHYRDYVERRGSGQASPVRISSGSKRKTRRRFGFRQWWTLTRRTLTIKRKDVANTLILLLQAPVIAGILCLVFAGETDGWQERLQTTPFALFLLVVSSVWFGCSNAAREIVGEAAIYRRERMVNLKLPSYLMSKVAVLGLVSALQCFMMLLFTHPILEFRGSFLEMWVILCLCSSAGVGMGLILSSVVRTSEAAIALVPMLLIPQVILAGAIMPIHKLDGPVKLASTAMVARWGFEAMIYAEKRGDGFEIPQIAKRKAKAARKQARKAGMEPRSHLPPRPLPRFFGEEKTSSLADFLVLLGFNGGLLLGVLIVLGIRDPDHG